MWEGVITRGPLRVEAPPAVMHATPETLSHDYQARQATSDDAACIVDRADMNCIE
jgi:hypothetical protein